VPCSTACAFTIAAAPAGSVDSARFTFAIARHAVVDLSYSFRVSPADPPERLGEADLAQLLEELRARGVEPGADAETIRTRMAYMRQGYEPYVNALARRLELNMPPWLAPESPTDNWRTTSWH
jgi:hypothetical protein